MVVVPGLGELHPLVLAAVLMLLVAAYCWPTPPGRRRSEKLAGAAAAGQPGQPARARGRELAEGTAKGAAKGAAEGAGEGAAEAWLRGDGRQKHCTLRPSALAGRPPPVYSLENLDLPLPDLGPSEPAALQLLAERVADLRAAGIRTDSGTLLRFLRARKGHVGAAEGYFRQAASYRDQLKLNQLETHWNLEAYERCLAPWYVRGGIVGLSHQGGIIGLERFGRSCFPDLLKMLPWDVLVRLDAVHMVRTLAAFEEDSLRRRAPLGNAILVLDLDGLDWSYCTPQVARAYGKLVEGRDMLCPSTLAHVFLIRAPRFFSAVWSTVKHVLDPATREKVRIISDSAESLELLRRHMSDSVIPAYLGGGLRISTDAECRPILGAGSAQRIPPEAISRLLALTGSKGAEDAAALVGPLADPGASAEELKEQYHWGCLGRSPCVAR